MTKEPNCSGGIENCAQSSGSGTCYNDLNCANSLNYVCEYSRALI